MNTTEEANIGDTNMLSKGRFIKETPPKIGAHYAPVNKPVKPNPEETFIQNILLGGKPQKAPVLSKVLHVILSV